MSMPDLSEEQTWALLGTTADQGSLLCSEVMSAILDSLEPQERFKQ